MSRARSHSAPNITGKLSRRETRTRSLVSATVHSGMAKAVNAAFSAAAMPAQPSTSVLSQSYSRTAGTPPFTPAPASATGNLRDQADLAVRFQPGAVGVLVDLAVDRHRHALLDLFAQAGITLLEFDHETAEGVGRP